jgi:hypothetical protein
MAGLLDPMKGDGSYVENRPSKWAQTWGILEPYVMGPANAWKGLMDADLETLLYDKGPAAQRAVENSFDVGGTLTGASSVASKPDNALNMGFRVFHGSPHDFPPVRLIEMPDGQRLYQNMGELADTPQGAKIIQEYPMGRFDLSKIGTGEGAQAYGHGLYFAEREGIARSYRDALAAGVKPELRPTDKYSTVGWKAEAEKLFPNDRERQAAFHLFNQMKNKDYVLENHDFITSLPHNQGKPYEWEGVEFTRDRLAQLADEFYDPGKMYEVEIKADPDAFLDWDKPLSEQPEAVKQAFRFMNIADESVWPNITANDAYEMLRVDSMGDDAFMRDQAYRLARRKDAGAGASGMLREAGIPGIKYLDAGSRPPTYGPYVQDILNQFGSKEKALEVAKQRLASAQSAREQIKAQEAVDALSIPETRNYVVFDDSLIEILRKYGIAGLLGGGAALNSMQGEPQKGYQ